MGHADRGKNDGRAYDVRGRIGRFTNCAKDFCAIRLIALEAQMGR